MRTSRLLNDLLSRVTEVGRVLTIASRGQADAGQARLTDLCEAVLSRHGEATGLALGREILDRYAELDQDGKLAFFRDLNTGFGVDQTRLSASFEEWREQQTNAAARALHFASEPRSQELIRRLNRAPGGILDLVAMRGDLLRAIRTEPGLEPLDRDFQHLFASWFNRGFLELRSIDWSTPADILEKIICYEAVHEIDGWDALRLRVAASDRRLYAFFHPALKNEPLIFVEVALMGDIPAAVGPILSDRRNELDPKAATTAVFYSISNCQAGLKGISFGNFLIKQVVEELRREFGNIETFVTLSPVPGLCRWVESQLEAGDCGALSLPEAEAAAAIIRGDGPEDAAERLAGIAARYLLEGKSPGGLPADPVARFHLGNGARLERINTDADMSPRAIGNSWGVMVNYLYDLGDIERNHEAFANEGQVIGAPAVRNLLKLR